MRKGSSLGRFPPPPRGQSCEGHLPPHPVPTGCLPGACAPLTSSLSDVSVLCRVSIEIADLLLMEMGCPPEGEQVVRPLQWGQPHSHRSALPGARPGICALLGLQRPNKSQPSSGVGTEVSTQSRWAS